MRNLKNKTLSILLAIVMLLGMMPMSVFAAEPEVVKSYSVATLYSDGTLEIFADVSNLADIPWQNERASIIKVVFTVDTPLYTRLFSDCTNLAEITLPSTVTEIPSYCFNSCPSLTSITIPDSVTSIGERAFSGCSVLGSVIFGENSNLQSIGNYAFNQCDALTSITIPDSVTSIGNWSFNSCDTLASIVIPDSVTSIGDRAFSECKKLSSIALGVNSQLQTIGIYAFNNCDVLTSIAIPDTVTSIGNSAFNSCDALASIVIPDSVTSISNGAFSSCKALASITIPVTVTSIGEMAFYDCDALASITIPNSVASIGKQAFYGCNVLTDIYYEGTVESWNSISKGDGAIPNGVKINHTGDCVDGSDSNHTCDLCGKSVGSHADIDKDHVCDYGCTVTIGTCEDADKDHDCDYGCDKVYGTHEDTNTDHACDYGCAVAIGAHADSDTDADHDCDYGCGATLENCTDAENDNNHSCDVCEKADVSTHTYGNATCEVSATCSECGTTTGDALGHNDENKDHTCDRGCGKTDIGIHGDSNLDHACDYGCAVAIGTHAAATGKHTCDYCGSVMSSCKDDDENHFCDICGAELTHDYSTEWKSDATNHWHECSCGAKADSAAHNGGTATCKDKAVCSTCDTAYGDLADHSYGTEWKFDGTNHWHECSCGAKSDEATHNGGTATCKDKAACSACGTTYGEFDAHTYENGKCTVCKAADPNYVSETDSPQTGDNSHMALWIALLFISGGAVITLTVVDRRRRNTAKH